MKLKTVGCVKCVFINEMCIKKLTTLIAIIPITTISRSLRTILYSFDRAMQQEFDGVASNLPIMRINGVRFQRISNETVVLRRWEVLQDNLVLSTGLIV